MNRKAPRRSGMLLVLVSVFAVGCDKEPVASRPPDPAAPVAVPDEAAVESSAVLEQDAAARSETVAMTRPEPEAEEGEAIEPAALDEDLAQCAPAQDKIIDVGSRINESIASRLQADRDAWIQKCEARVKAGDDEFRDDLRCVSASEGLDDLMHCDGWTDWPGM
ncbi:MAG: hypothetical protein ACE37F_01665 [Nannocystaceae bacterium]|nr:hypothetical protein [bacterium]